MKMEINKEGTAMVVALEGRLDTTTAPELEAALKESLAGCQSLTLDLAKLEYVSSAGLRVILSAQKRMNQREGAMVVEHVSPVILEIFEITGFTDVLTIR